MCRRARRLFTLNQLLVWSVCLALSGCLACWSAGKTAHVLVVERKSGRPVAGAVVRPHYDDCHFGEPTAGQAVRTVAAGRATINIREAITYPGFTVEAEGYEQYLPPNWWYSEGTYMGVAADDGTRILHVWPVTAK